MGQEANELRYSCTNEKIEAVLAGLGMNSPTHPDKILAIGGSGDIAFALLPFVERVVVVDRNSAQVSLIRERAKLLREKDHSGFLEYTIRGSCDGNDEDFLGRKSRRRDYFSKEGRLDEISKRMDRLEILDADDIFEVLKNETTYSGMYLSNVLGTLPNRENETPARLKALQQKLDYKGGLLYVSDGDQISKINVPPIRIGKLVSPGVLLPPGLYEDERLTGEARKYGETIAGLPTVFRNEYQMFLK